MTALSRWPFRVRSCVLVAQRENAVFRVEDDKGDAFALRLHRRGYRDAAEIKSELHWMAALDAAGLSVPRPVPSLTGTHVESVAGGLVSVLTWLPGLPLGATGGALAIADRTGAFHRFGRTLARLHAVSDRWTMPAGFSRPSWDIEGLVGETPYWGRFWDNPSLTDEERHTLLAARHKARNELLRQGAGLDFGLIHADVVRENVLVDKEAIRFIDFDDSGTGFRLFDLATALLKNISEVDYPDLEVAFLAGYRTEREIDLDLLPLFMMLRAFSYVGWIIPRLGEPGGEERNRRNITASLGLARRFLES